MCIKVTCSGDNRYVQLAESYRNEGGKPRQRVIANLGRLDDNASSAQPSTEAMAALLQATGQQAGRKVGWA